MNARISWKCFGGSIGVALLLSTLGIAGSAPAYGHDDANSTPKTNVEQEQRAMSKIEADMSRLKQDFAALPPEVNSARMYAGPGSSSMLAAASAWNDLATELQTAANSYSSVVSELTSQAWLGPASSSTTTADAPYVGWMHSTAQQAEHDAAQAKTEAATFEWFVKEGAESG
jgi:hypothetical protein